MPKAFDHWQLINALSIQFINERHPDDPSPVDIHKPEYLAEFVAFVAHTIGYDVTADLAFVALVTAYRQ